MGSGGGWSRPGHLVHSRARHLQEVQELQKFVKWSESESSKISARIETLQAKSATRILKQFMNSELGPVNALVEAIKEISQNLQGSEASISPAEGKALDV